MIIDFHTHSNTSIDTDMTVMDIYETAAAKGIKNICITSHHEPIEIRNGDLRQSMTDEKLDKYVSEIEELKKDGRVNIFVGTEIGYDEESEDAIRAFIKKKDFDYVLGSIHYVFGHIIASTKRKFPTDKYPAEQVLKEYFRLLKKAIGSGMFDAIGHIDIYRRMLPELDSPEAEPEWKEIAQALIKNDVGFEINTSQSKKEPEGMFPRLSVLKVLIENGVKKITIGSDAHAPEEIGRNLDHVKVILKELGIKEVYLFERRKAKPLLL
ncbi:MAG: histidinol-phosphatase HisJ family protein [Candidatus Woesearchaeota archaeon]